MKNIHDDLVRVFESKTALKVLCGIGIMLVALLIFYAGVNVGFHKASFGRAWGENYERNFGFGPDHPLLGTDNFPNANGAIGKIIKIELPTIIVQDKDNTEKVVLLGNDTKIEKAMTSIQQSDLSVNDFVVVIGSPNDQGQIEAKFIRVMPLGMPVPPTQMPAPIQQ
ncbi:MAG: hypothetical protein P4L63_02535 [Candidatus Pacebacteria bacterium]|nr:hypothetical protein [Candidatus Paceibacterota bacterium]